MSQFHFTYRADIQGLRGIAVLLVVLYHAGFSFPGGFVGVDVFFVISGYVITGNILNQLEKGSFSLREFFTRRIRRLLPLLAAVVSVCLLLNTVLAPISSHIMAGRTAIAAIFWNANHYLIRTTNYFDPVAERNPFLHTWSLSVEEQFYLVFPLVIMGAWWKFGRKGTQAAVIGLIGLSLGASIVLAQWNLFGPITTKLAFFSSFTRAWEFGAGALAALAAARLSNMKNADAIAGLGVVGLISSAFLFDSTTPFPSYNALLPVAATGALIVAGIGGSRVSSLLGGKPLTFLGDLSYGWYLWHWPLMVYANALFPGEQVGVGIACVLSLGLAQVSKTLIEDPFRRPTHRHIFAFIATCIAIPLLALGASKLLNVELATMPNTSELNAMLDSYNKIGCDDSTDHDFSRCDWNKDGKNRVVLLGDSNARMFIPALRDPVFHDYHITAKTKSGCPITQAEQYRLKEHHPCTEWLAAVEAWLQQEPNAVVLVATAEDLYIENPSIFFEVDARHVNDRETKTKLLADGLKELAQRLPQHRFKQIPLIPKFVHGSPTSHVYTAADDCSILALETDPSLCAPPTQHDDLVYAPLLCGKKRCAMYEGQWLYRDGGHLSVVGSTKLTPHFQTVLK